MIFNGGVDSLSGVLTVFCPIRKWFGVRSSTSIGDEETVMIGLAVMN